MLKYFFKIVNKKLIALSVVTIAVVFIPKSAEALNVYSPTNDSTYSSATNIYVTGDISLSETIDCGGTESYGIPYGIITIKSLSSGSTIRTYDNFSITNAGNGVGMFNVDIGVLDPGSYRIQVRIEGMTSLGSLETNAETGEQSCFYNFAG